MKKLLVTIFGIVSLALVGSTLIAQPTSAAIDVFKNCNANGGTEICKATNDRLFGPNSIWTNILNTLVYVTGAVSILMIVIGGLRYTLSNGDQSGINSAKNTILYAVVGLILSVMGYAIVNFVLSSI